MITEVKTKVYAGRLKDRASLLRSSSGGAFVALSDCFLDNGLDFVTRLKLNRWLIVHNKNGGEVPVKTANLEKHMKLNFRAQITKIDNGKEKLLNLKFGIKKVQLQILFSLLNILIVPCLIHLFV